MKLTEKQINLLLTEIRKVPGITFSDYTINLADDAEEIMIDYDSDKLLQTLNISFFVYNDKIECGAIFLNLAEENILDDFNYPTITNLDYTTIVKFISDCEKFIVKNYGDYSTKEGQLKIINNELSGIDFSMLNSLQDYIELPDDSNHKVFELLDKLQDDTDSVNNIFLKDKKDINAYACINEIMRTLHYDNGKPLTTDEYNYFDHYDRDQDFWGYFSGVANVDHFELSPSGDFCAILDMTYETLKDDLTTEYDGSNWEHDFRDGDDSDEEDPLNLDFD